MTSPAHSSKHFRVVSPARAYSVLVGVSALLLAIGLILPLTLASSGSSVAAPSHAGGAPVKVEGGTAGDSDQSGTSTADQIPTTVQGVTDSTIKVGVVLLDLSSVTSLGLGLPNYGVDQQEAAYNSIFDAINAQGGINGRTIQPVYESRDSIATTGPHSDKSICLKLAKDEQVFAVIGLTYASGECVTEQFGLPVVTRYPSLEKVYEDTHGLLTTLDPPLEQVGRDWATVIAKSGLLDNHTLGLIDDADGSTYQLSAAAAADTLQKAGKTLTVKSDLDVSNTIAAIPPVIQKMKQAGVDEIMIDGDFSTALRFMALSEAQNYYPQYFTSDLGSLASNGLLAQSGKSFDGAIGFSDNQWAADGTLWTPANTACNQNYNETTTTKDVAQGQQSVIPLVCAITEVFTKAVTAAGTDLNPRTFVEGVESLGAIDDLPAVLPGSFGPGKTWYSGELQPLKWSAANKSYSPDGDPVSTH